MTLYEGGDKDAQPLLTEQKQIRCTTVQIWHTAPLLYSVCYRLFKIKIMPTYKFEIFVNEKLDYTCYTQGQVRMYECQLDFEGINYETVRTALF